MQDLSMAQKVTVVGSRLGNATAISLLQSKGIDTSTVKQVLHSEADQWADTLLDEAAGQVAVALGQYETDLQSIQVGCDIDCPNCQVASYWSNKCRMESVRSHQNGDESGAGAPVVFWHSLGTVLSMQQRMWNAQYCQE